MSIILLFLLLFLPLEGAVGQIRERSCTFSHLCGLKKSETVPPCLWPLLRAGGISGPLTWDQVLEATQKQWIATRHGLNGIERCDLVDTAQQLRMMPKIIDCLCQIGFFDASLPRRQKYCYGLCLGAFLPAVRARLFQLVEAWKKGVRFDSLIFLCGERPCAKSLQSGVLAALCNPALSPLPFRTGWQPSQEALYEREIDMARLVWDQVEIPEEMRRALEGHVQFIDAPKGVMRSALQLKRLFAIGWKHASRNQERFWLRAALSFATINILPESMFWAQNIL